MKNILKFSVLLLAAGLIAGLAGCSNGTSGGSNPGTGRDGIFDEDTSGKLLTTNLGAEDLVLFYDSVRSTNLLGGLPGNANRFKMKLPESNKMYVIYAVKYSDYIGKSSAEVQNIKVLDSTLVYSDSLDETTCRIGDLKAVGTAEVRFTNQTSYYIQVGKDSANDEDFFYVMRPNSEASVFVMPESPLGIAFYMTLHLPIKKNGKIIGVQRRFIDEWSDIYTPQPGVVTAVTIDATNITASQPNYREGYLRIVNNSGRGYRVRNGSQYIESTIGLAAIPNAGEQVWELEGENNAPGKSYAQLILQALSATNNLTISQFYIRNGYKYTLVHCCPV
jgi:hypothetical protein